MIKRWVRHPLEALALWLFFSLLGFLPTDRASDLGGWIGRKIGPKLRGDRVARTNLALAMPELSPAAVDRVVEQMWDNLGRTLAEYPHLKTITKPENGRITVRGIENVQPFLDQTSAGILLGGHLANWEVLATYSMQLGLPLSTIARPANNPWVNTLIERCRGDHGHKRIAKNVESAKQLLAALRGGGVVGMLADQKYNRGIELPFFGVPAPTTDAPAQLMLRTGCPVIPVQVTREGPSRFVIHCHGPIDTPPEDWERTERLRVIMTRYHDLLEGWIRERPAEWLWLHRRWPKDHYR